MLISQINYDNFISILQYIVILKGLAVITSFTSFMETTTKTRVNCENCWWVFQSWLPQNFPEIT